MRKSAARAAVVLLALQCCAVARAAGQPVLGEAPPSQWLQSIHHTYRYRALPSRRHTLVEKTTGRWTLSYSIPGKFAIPDVAYDGTPGGLSALRRTLVLVRPRTAFPQRTTVFAVLDADSLRLIRTVRLRGDFAFDAISPNGRWAYLIQYSGANAIRYRVRALDTFNGRLLQRDIIDPHDRGEKMQGVPVARAASTDGRWAYTLYASNEQPFIHALDTAGLTARCIDIPAFPSNVNPYSVRLRLVGDRLSVMVGSRTLSARNVRTWAPIDPPSASARGGAGGGGGVPATVVLAVVAAIAAAIVAGARGVMVRRARG
jgi:hypothetical protein